MTLGRSKEKVSRSWQPLSYVASTHMVGQAPPPAMASASLCLKGQAPPPKGQVPPPVAQDSAAPMFAHMMVPQSDAVEKKEASR